MNRDQKKINERKKEEKIDAQPRDDDNTIRSMLRTRTIIVIDRNARRYPNHLSFYSHFGYTYIHCIFNLKCQEENEREEKTKLS